jgi:biopolymer transport protein ExbD
MKLESKNKVDASFNMSSMTDLIFLLLIFFILTASITPSKKNVDLPQGAEPVVRTAATIVEITEAGKLLVNDKSVPLEDLVTALEGTLTDFQVDENEPIIHTVVLNADKKVKYKEVMKVMKECAKVKGIDVTLGTQP